MEIFNLNKLNVVLKKKRAETAKGWLWAIKIIIAGLIIVD
jgi:hypothetical protein